MDLRYFKALVRKQKHQIYFVVLAPIAVKILWRRCLLRQFAPLVWRQRLQRKAGLAPLKITPLVSGFYVLLLPNECLLRTTKHPLRPFLRLTFSNRI